jgi:hypothetical protein
VRGELRGVDPNPRFRELWSVTPPTTLAVVAKSMFGLSIPRVDRAPFSSPEAPGGECLVSRIPTQGYIRPPRMRSSEREGCQIS